MTNKIMSEIRKIDNLADLMTLTSFISDCKTMLGKSTLSVGDNVNVVQKTKKTPGTITKMNTSRAVVAIGGKDWIVPFSMLVKV
jgi:hypothetical protein|tara:strand:+ start:203 stop:454 length:252 start_codon:yes stop_codon:yes gene_type:complete